MTDDEVELAVAEALASAVRWKDPRGIQTDIFHCIVMGKCAKFSAHRSILLPIYWAPVTVWGSISYWEECATLELAIRKYINAAYYLRLEL